PAPSLPEGERGERPRELLLYPSSPPGRGGIGEVRDAGAATLKMKATVGSDTRVPATLTDTLGPILSLLTFQPPLCRMAAITEVRAGPGRLATSAAVAARGRAWKRHTNTSSWARGREAGRWPPTSPSPATRCWCWRPAATSRPTT